MGRHGRRPAAARLPLAAAQRMVDRVLRHAAAVQIHHTEIGLREDGALPRRLTPPLHRLQTGGRLGLPQGRLGQVLQTHPEAQSPLQVQENVEALLAQFAESLR